MTERLIDTNILVYAYDTSEGIKHDIARTLLKQIWEDGGGVVCVQNLMEFVFVITRKVECPITITEAKTIIEDIIHSEKWKVIDRDIYTFLHALELMEQHPTHFWDAAIIACMQENDVTEIITENAKDFENIPNIHVISPF